MIEIQSSVDYSMPIRINKYRNELIDRICINDNKKINSKKYRLPVIISIVIYDGKSKWNANLEFKQTFLNYKKYGKNITNFKYFLIDINSINVINSIENLTDIFICINQSIKDTNEFRLRLNIIKEAIISGKCILNEYDKSMMLDWLEYIYELAKITKKQYVIAQEMFSIKEDEDMFLCDLPRVLEKEKKEERKKRIRKSNT